MLCRGTSTSRGLVFQLKAVPVVYTLSQLYRPPSFVHDVRQERTRITASLLTLPLRKVAEPYGRDTVGIHTLCLTRCTVIRDTQNTRFRVESFLEY